MICGMSNYVNIFVSPAPAYIRPRKKITQTILHTLQKYVLDKTLEY
jgi:hypothetical protein